MFFNKLWDYDFYFERKCRVNTKIAVEICYCPWLGLQIFIGRFHFHASKKYGTSKLNDRNCSSEANILWQLKIPKILRKDWRN